MINLRNPKCLYRSAIAFAVCILVSSTAFAAPNGCPKNAEKLDEICEKQPEAKKAECAKSCGKKINAWNEKVADFNKDIKTCSAMNEKTCGIESGGSALTSEGAIKTGADSAGKGSACSAKKSALSRGIGAEQKKICGEIKSECKGMDGAGDQVKKCEKSAAEAEKTAKENDAKAKEMAGQEKKGDENDKKQESAGGMPPMPQMPPPSEKKEETPEQAEAPTNSDPTISSSTAPQIESSKFGDGKSDIAPPVVGFGGSDTSTNTDTGIGGNASFPVQSFATDGVFRDPAESALGDNGMGSSAASSASPGGGGGMAGGGNSTGASRPGEGGVGAAAAPGDTANPYEVPVGSAGRLGIPKGKSSEDSDSALDAAATANFEGDFKGGGENGTGEEQASGDEEDIGYTVFKMVKYRYSELKKKGSI